MRRWELTGSEYTKYWRVNIMWHTAAIVKILEEQTEGNGYDKDQNRHLGVE